MPRLILTGQLLLVSLNVIVAVAGVIVAIRTFGGL